MCVYVYVCMCMCVYVCVYLILLFVHIPVYYSFVYFTLLIKVHSHLLFSRLTTHKPVSYPVIQVSITRIKSLHWKTKTSNYRYGMLIYPLIVIYSFEHYSQRNTTIDSTSTKIAKYTVYSCEAVMGILCTQCIIF